MTPTITSVRDDLRKSMSPPKFKRSWRVTHCEWTLDERGTPRFVAGSGCLAAPRRLGLERGLVHCGCNALVHAFVQGIGHELIASGELRNHIRRCHEHHIGD